MSDAITRIFDRKRVEWHKLPDFGFAREGDDCVYRVALEGSGFILAVAITPQGQVRTEVTDPAFGEPYTLHLSDSAVGSFVNGVRAQCEAILQNIARRCFVPDVFKSVQAGQLISYVRERYGDELEFLWAKLPDNAVWRRKDTGKWYGVLLTLSGRKLGAASDDVIEIVDLRIPPDELAALVDGKTYFPGYHMNKQRWCTVVLDGSADLADICRLLDASYRLATK
ncbi:MAG: MmcQ/YjbR family DNA-binding protein [Clostridia bacterium]|nr:MmcQ/YjbR family DNA-binding protein [Clostridia bacterium]